MWLSGQIPADINGKLIEGTISEKTEAIIQNTEAILREAGSSLEQVVKVVVRDTLMIPSLRSTLRS